MLVSILWNVGQKYRTYKLTSWWNYASVTITITEYWVTINEKSGNFVCVRERDASCRCHCRLECLPYEKLVFHCRHPIPPSLVNLLPVLFATSIETVVFCRAQVKRRTSLQSNQTHNQMAKGAILTLPWKLLTNKTAFGICLVFTYSSSVQLN